MITPRLIRMGLGIFWFQKYFQENIFLKGFLYLHQELYVNDYVSVNVTDYIWV